MVGLPGTGKSTLLDFVDNPEFGDSVFVYSTDNYIERVAADQGKTYDDLFSDYIKKATVRMDALLDVAIKEGVEVYWDQTNLGIGKRRKIINRMTQAGYDVECVCILPPDSEEDNAEWNRRLDSRKGKSIPRNVIQSMKDSFVIPSTEEGFTNIRFYDMYGRYND